MKRYVYYQPNKKRFKRQGWRLSDTSIKQDVTEEIRSWVIMLDEERSCILDED